MRRRFPLLLVAAIGFAGGTSLAQTAPGAPGGNQVIPEKVAPPVTEPNGVPLATGRSESLSQKLDSSGGVIKPKPGVDPGIVKTAPDPEPNSTPVVRPPGTPGGAPGPEAK
jgi:hypothetical protein